MLCESHLDAVNELGNGMNPNIRNEGKATRFKPGQSGNPAGRPRRNPLVNRLEAMLERPLSPEVLKLVRPVIRAELPECVIWADALVISIMLRAINKAEVATFREIRETIEGKTRYR